MRAPMPRVESLLSNLSLFRELPAGDIAAIAGQTRQIREERGAVLFRRGDPSTGMYVLVYGQVKLSFVSAAGNEKVIEFLGDGQSFGEAVMFLEKPHVVTATVLADSLLLYVAREVIFESIDHRPQFARRVIGGLSMRLHQLVTDVESLSTRSGTERVIGFLLRDTAEDATESAIEITLPVAKGIVASRLNLTQEHFSRILHELVANGLIEVQGRTIRVPDLEKLRSHAG
jgi:CRP-like cAMP-binding protein